MFQSTASIACSWLIVCVTSTAIAPSSATFVRSILSVAIVASAMTKMAIGSGHAETRADQSSRLTCEGAYRRSRTAARRRSPEECGEPFVPLARRDGVLLHRPLRRVVRHAPARRPRPRGAPAVDAAGCRAARLVGRLPVLAGPLRERRQPADPVTVGRAGAQLLPRRLRRDGDARAPAAAVRQLLGPARRRRRRTGHRLHRRPAPGPAARGGDRRREQRRADGPRVPRRRRAARRPGRRAPRRPRRTPRPHLAAHPRRSARLRRHRHDLPVAVGRGELHARWRARHRLDARHPAHRPPGLAPDRGAQGYRRGTPQRHASRRARRSEPRRADRRPLRPSPRRRDPRRLAVAGGHPQALRRDLRAVRARARRAPATRRHR